HCTLTAVGGFTAVIVPEFAANGCAPPGGLKHKPCLGRAGWARGGRREYVLVGLAAASMRRTPPRAHPARPLTVSVCVHHGKQRRKSKATAGRFARSSRSSLRWIPIHQFTNQKSRADARLHRECFVHAWRGSTVSTRVDTHQQQPTHGYHA